MRTALAIAGKDLRQRVRDRSALAVALVAPFVLASIFGLVLHDVGGGKLHFRYAVVDRDRGAVAQALSTHLAEAVRQAGIGSVAQEPAATDAGRLVRDGRVAAAVVVPAGFSAAVAGGRPATVVVVGDERSPIGTLVAASLATGFAVRVDAVRTAAVATGAANPQTLAGAVPEPLRVTDVTAASRQLDATTFYAAGMAVFFLFFSVQFGVLSLLEERRDGTLARILAAPVRRSSVLAGKLLTSVAIGVASMTVLTLATRFTLGAAWGNPLGVAMLIVAGVLAATAVSALVGTFAETPDQAGPWLSMVAVLLGMLGGTFFPVARAGGLVEDASLATPHAWFLRGLENLHGGAGPGAALGPVAAILAFAAVVGAVAFVRSGRLLAR